MEADTGKPRRCSKFLKKDIFNYYNKEMEEETKRFNIEDVNFHLFQSISNKEKIEEEILKVTYFYDRNYIGNKDFIEIPDLKSIVYNVSHYPIIMASKKVKGNEEDLLGLTTIKFENNKNLTDNPFFPTKGENILSITGILTKLSSSNDRVRNIGKGLFKAGIKGAFEINKKQASRLICKVDCRNINSLYGICKSVKELQQEGTNVQIFIDGYYEIFNTKRELLEAPTFVLEIDLNNKRMINNNFVTFSYSDCNSVELSRLSEVIKENTIEKNQFLTIKGNDMITYHKIEPINALNVELNVGNSAIGNLRIPELPIIINPSYANTNLS